MIPHSRPSLGPAEAEAAARVIRSGQVAQGPEVAAFEAELADRLGVAHVVAVSSGTAALHLVLLALDIGPGHHVAIPSYVCAALIQAVRHAGAQPLLLDADPSTLSLSIPRLREQDAGRVRAVLLPHMFGRAAELDAAGPLPFDVVEDCAMALGARSKGRPLGAIGAAGVFSFYATKMICSGEGGAVSTSDDGLAERLRDLRDYDGRWNTRPRFNHKLTDIQAAMARVQLSRLDSFIQRRRELADRYTRRLSGTVATLPGFGADDVPFRYVVRHPAGAEALIPRFEAAGVAARRPVHCPLHRLEGLSDDAYPVAAQLYHEALSLPLYPGLTDSEAETVLRAAGAIL